MGLMGLAAPGRLLGYAGNNQMIGRAKRKSPARFLGGRANQFDLDQIMRQTDPAVNG
jgi:hypothetical protein